MHRVLRLYATATSTDADRLLTVCAELEADLVILAARSDPLRDTVLVAIVRTPSVTCIMDTSLLSLARRPRVFDIQKLFKGLDALGLLQTAQTFETIVDDTSEMEPAAAVDHLLLRPRQRFNLEAFLALHSNGQALEASEFRVAAEL
jgi:hypothetical protein